ncbi:MAG: hypothetical protein ACKVRO_07580 [Micropepsaceae bacterium]
MKDARYRRGSFRTQFGSTVHVILWATNCTNDGCLYDFLNESPQEKFASIRAFNLKRTSAFRNGYPVFIDATLQLFWWDGDKFLRQPLMRVTSDPTASASQYLNLAPAAWSKCAQVWKLRDPDWIYATDNGQIQIRGLIYRFLGEWDGLAASPPICIDVIIRNNDLRIVGKKREVIPFFGLNTSSLPKEIQQRLDTLYGEEVDIICSEAWQQETGLRGPSYARCTVASIRRVRKGRSDDPTFDPP